MPDPLIENLHKVDHVVVLMQENRSFDHLLGYLSLEGGRDDVDGLAPGMKNVHAGRDYPIRHLDDTRLRPGQNPCHGGVCVARQMANDMGGFVAEYATDHPGDPDPGVVMGYYDGADLPVYDHLAREFAVCDRWFCSVPGATWPNRLYAAAGRADGSLDNRTPIPLYDVPSFPRQLDAAGVSWRWYYHDVPTLRLIDRRYRFAFGAFASFEQRRFGEPKTFLDAVAAGDLPAVCWIDPNFTDVTQIGPRRSNDDHPPADVRNGQELVLKIYHALATSALWKTSLLVVVYDEHGGLFEHVPPPQAAGGDARFRGYGPRVPALVVSPWVERGVVSHVPFDHTSIVRTILERFCRRPDGSVPEMGPRVAAARHLGSLLTRGSPRDAPPLDHLAPAIDAVAEHRAASFAERLRAPIAARDAAPPDEFQLGLILAMRELEAEQRRGPDTGSVAVPPPPR